MFASLAYSVLCENTFDRRQVIGFVRRHQRSGIASSALLFAIIVLGVLLPQPVLAQTNYTSSDQTVDGVSMMPTPGGHDYQHLLSETVQFSNGQISYRVQYPMPKGRGISFPYWYGYSSAGLYRMFFQVGQNTLTWTTNDLNFNGTGPVATWQVTLNPQQTISCGPPNSGDTCYTWPCYQATGFTFFDMSGTNHNLYGMSALAPQGTPPTPTTPPTYVGICADPNSGGAGGGSDGEVTAQFTPPSVTVSNLSSTGAIGSFTVTDKNGTTYFFGGGSPTLKGGVFEASPTKIEDRNGNIISLGSNGWVDTLGRIVATGYQGVAQTIGGISYPAPTAPSGAPATVQVSYTVPTSLNTNPCFIMSGVNIGQVTGTQPAWTGVGLPDGTQYTLFYGTYNPNDSTLVNNYGLLNEVVFPGGGWIKYQWSINSSVANEIGQFPQLGNNTNGVNIPCYIGYSTPRLAHRYVSYDGVNVAQQQDFTYTTNWSSSGSTGFFSPAGWTSKTTTVVTTDKVKGQNFQTVYTYVPLGPASQIGDGPEIPVEQTVQYYDWGNTKTLKTVNKTWAGLSAMTCEVTTVNGLTAGHVYQYGASPMVLSELTDDKEYDWSTSTPSSICGGTSTAILKREKTITYQSFLTAATPYNSGEGEPGGVFYKPETVVTYDGNSNKYAETDYSYDQFSLASMSGVVQHDDGVFTTSETVRGNVTTITKQCFGCASGNAVTLLTYDQTGQVATQKDPCGNTSCSDVTGSNHTTTYSFVDSSPGNPAGQSNAYLTTVTFPQTGTTVHQVTYAYNYTLGYLTTSYDENNQYTTYKYGTQPSGCSFADNLERLTEIDYPDGGVTTYCYDDAPYNTSTPSPSVTTTTKITSSVSKTSVVAFDGMGHTVETLLTTDPDGTDYTNTTYYGMGNAYQISNPHRSASSSTDGTATYVYDALGRTETVTEPDSSIVSTTYDQLNSTYPSVLCTTVTDEVSTSRQSCADGLGRMTYVFEDPGSSPHLGYETDYTYDPLNNLLSVTQKGNSSGNSRPRTFAYDSLSRLTTASNPESGTIQYAYDVNGNLSSKTAPSPNQSVTPNPPQATTSYTYDVLDRVKSKSYADAYSSNPPTPSVTFGYDGVSLTGCTIAPPGDTDTYPTGRATSMCDGSGGTSWTHDQMGRVLQERRAIGSSNANHYVDYAYNLDGSLKTLQTPPMKVLNYTVKGAGRATQLVDSTDNINFALTATYAPPGELVGVNLGSGTGSFAGFTVTNAYNARLQPILLSASTGSTTIFSECYDFHSEVAISQPSPCSFPASTTGNNGNVYQIVNNRDGTRSQNFLYDPLNRIWQAYTTGANWGETYSLTPQAPGTPFSAANAGIDPWGNLTNRSGVTGKTYYEPLSCLANVDNQLTGCLMTYDDPGNMTANGNISYVYDDENRLVWSAGERYIYDGKGERVEKCQAASATTACPTSGTTGTLYWRGTGSDTLAETDLGGNQQEEYIFFNGLRIARRDVSSTGATVGLHYYFSDHLGTHGVVESVSITSGAISCDQDMDYYPYGGQENDYCASNGISQNYKFTGKERDPESCSAGSCLDNFGARFDATSLGRFMTPDWAEKPIDVPYADFGDPQSLNLYSYVRNNPLAKPDLDGHEPDILVIENGPTEGNPIGHTAIAVTGQGVFSFGTGTKLGGSTTEYLKDQATRRSTTVTVIKTTPEQDKAAVNELLKQDQKGAIVRYPDNCSARSNAALDAAGVTPPEVTINPFNGIGVQRDESIPGTAGDRAQDTTGSQTFNIPQGSTSIPSQLNQFNPGPNQNQQLPKPENKTVPKPEDQQENEAPSSS